MIWKLLITFLLAGAFSSCGSDSSASVETLTGSVWSLTSIKVNDTTIKFTGKAQLFFKDGGFVYHEAYLSAPDLDYGPCWFVSTGTIESTDSELSTTRTDHSAREFCSASGEEKTTSTYTIEDGVLTFVDKESESITVTSTYEKDESTDSLEFATLKELVDSKNPITVNADADSYIEDKNENENLTLLETECDLDWNYGVPKIKQYFSSELWPDRIISMDYYGPEVSDWIDNTYIVEDSSDDCNSPGYRDHLTTDLSAAKASSMLSDILYGCGGKCTYTLVSETHDANDTYTSLSMTWVCENIASNSLSNPSLFGLTIDKHVGKVTCTQ